MCEREAIVERRKWKVLSMKMQYTAFITSHRQLQRLLISNSCSHAVKSFNLREMKMDTIIIIIITAVAIVITAFVVIVAVVMNHQQLQPTCGVKVLLPLFLVTLQIAADCMPSATAAYFNCVMRKLKSVASHNDAACEIYHILPICLVV